MKANKVIDALLGVAVGDAVGVPFEFKSRQAMADHPAVGMTGYGTYNLPPGTWSDDSSLTFCLAEALTQPYSLRTISENFIKWKNEAWWTARGSVFDIGMTTSRSIARVRQLIENNEIPELAQQKYYGDEYDNGNGSLMRILPLLFYLKDRPITEQFEIIWENSALTHRHIRAAMSCLIYLKLAEKLLEGQEKSEAYTAMRGEIHSFWDKTDFSERERKHFEKVIQNDIRTTKVADLKTGGYVIEVLESSIWFFLSKASYQDTVLSIINLGHDTDTSAAIAGGLAGLYYGHETIPDYWRASLARLDDIIDLGKRVAASPYLT